MREVDSKAINEYQIPGIVLMENAGREVAQAVKRAWETADYTCNPSVALFCAKGNNGGDGFVAARHLVNFGFDVAVFLLANPDDIKGDSAINFNIIRNMGLNIKVIENDEDMAEAAHYCKGAFAIVDALFGTGLRGEIKGIAQKAIELINSLNTYVLAVDIPSGISGENGKVLGTAVKAKETITMQLPKTGLLLYPGASYVGKLTIADIGIDKRMLRDFKPDAELTERHQVANFFKTYSPDTHKGTFGKLLILAGSQGMTGAASLSSLSAIRSGAGLVTLGIPKSLNEIMEVKLTEVMTKPLPETKNRSFSLNALDKALEFASKCDAIAIGPGISADKETQEFTRKFIVNCDIPIVIDADGLNAIAEDVEVLKKAGGPVVITPHPGEMARLLSTTTTQVQRDRLNIAKSASEKLMCTVLLKGARTLIATPDGKLWINPTGNPGMSTGGSGDVLTGMISAFLARGMSCENAAVAGAYIHGMAGDLAAYEKGETSMIASDIIDFIPKAFKNMFKNKIYYI
jgi:hydroxyethylthiazole kinase-like uncharacterized protein yjeF